MTRSEMDCLKVGDKVEVRTYDTTKEEYVWVPAVVSNIYVCEDGGKFLHGGYHSVYAKVNGRSEPLDCELTRKAV